MSRRGPRLVRALLIRVVAPEDRDFVVDDLDARYRAIAAERGDAEARRWYRSQVVRAIPTLLADRLRDLRDAGVSGIGREFGRVLRRSVRAPLYAVGFAGTLALGLGSLALLGTLAWDVWLSPLPVPDPDRVVRIYELGRPATETGVRPRNRVSPPFLHDMRDHDWSTISVVAGVSMDSPEWTGDAGARQLTALRVTSEYVAVLGLSPTLGRLAWDEGQPQVMVSERFWRSAFGADPALAQGGFMTLDGVDHQVVGVVALPAGYPTPADVLLPLSFRENQLSEGMRGARYLEAIARVAPGRSAEDASAEVAAFVAALGPDHPQHDGWSGEAVNLGKDLTRPVRGIFALLLGAGVAFLTLAVVNVTGLVAARRVETEGVRSIQRALGASSGRLVRDSLVESLFLGGLGSLLGIAGAAAVLPWIVARLPADLPRLDAVAFTPLDAAYLLGAGVVLSGTIGLASHWISLTASGHVASRSVSAALGHRRWLIVGQVAITTMLVGGGLMMVEEAAGLRTIDMGFDPGEVHIASINLPDQGFPDQASRLAFWESLLSELKAGGAQAAVVSNATLSGSMMNYGFLPEGADTEVFGQYHHVTTDYFELLSIDVMAGRTFLPSEEGPVIIVNEVVADEHFGGEDPLGRTIRLLNVDRTVVGVVAATRHFGPDQPAPAEIYVPLREDTWGFAQVIVEDQGQADRLVGTVAALAPGLEAPSVAPYADLLSDWFAPVRLQVIIVGILSLTGMLLAALGLYAAIAWQVGARTREIGIRLALGAPRVDLFGTIVRQGATLALMGALGGLALWLMVWGRLSGVLNLDLPPSVAVALGAVGIVLAVSIVAVAVPALRSTRVDPATSLRRD